MHPTLEQFSLFADRLSTVVDTASAAGWEAPSPCAGWTARDVVDHVVDSQRDFLARQELSTGDRPDGTPPEVWSTHLAAVRRVLGDGAVLDREFDSYFGPSTIGETLATFFNLDLVIHRWDLARSFGDTTNFSDAEMDHVEACLDQLGDNIYAHGACAPAVPVADDASRQNRLIARTGRDPR